MSSVAMCALGERLERARARRFVGRAPELDLFDARLATAGPSSRIWAGDETVVSADDADLFSVLWVHGPGGIGKSSLLAAYADAARDAGCSLAQVDADHILPTPAGLQTAVQDSLRRAAGAEPARQPIIRQRGEFGPKERCVVIIDAAERLQPVERWLRDDFLPGLPVDAVVVIAGRRPPSDAWRADPGWRDLLRVVSLRTLTHDAVAALLEGERLPAGLLGPVMELTHGHPLALSLLLDAIRRAGTGAAVPETLQDLPDLVTALLHRLVDQAPSARHRAALQVCAHAPVTSEPVLRAVLPNSDAGEVSELWDWLHDLTFVEATPAGLRPHELARDVLDADLRSRDPDTYATLHRRLRGYVIDRLKTSVGDPLAQQRAVGDLLFLVRHHPVGGAGWDWDAFGKPPGEPVGPDQAEAILALTRTAQGERQAELVEHWLRRQPTGFRLFRDSAGDLAGFVARLSLHLAEPCDIEADPGTAVLWRYAQEHRRPGPGEQVLAWRFLVDRDPDERRPRLSGTLFGVWHLTDILLRPPTAWDFIATYTDLDHWGPFFRHWDFVHLAEADHQIGPSRYRVFGHDWRRIPVSDWLERTAARELGHQVAPDETPATVLSREEFAASVKQALWDLHQPHALVRNPLMASAMVQHRLRDAPAVRADQVLRELIEQATQVLRSDRRADAWYRVIDRTYLRPAASQEKAAALLDLPFTTYRRYRNRGLEVITDWLWQLDIDSSAQRSFTPIRSDSPPQGVGDLALPLLEGV